MRVEHLPPKLRAEALNEALRQEQPTNTKNLGALFNFINSDKPDFWWDVRHGKDPYDDYDEDGTLDLDYDQQLASIRPSGSEAIGYILCHRGLLKTEGQIGERYYPNFIELIKGLQGKGITLDMFYF